MCRSCVLSVCLCLLPAGCVGAGVRGLKKKEMATSCQRRRAGCWISRRVVFRHTVTATAPGRNAADWVPMFEHAKVEIAEHGAISRRARKGTIDRGRAGGKNFELNRDLDR